MPQDNCSSLFLLPFCSSCTGTDNRGGGRGGGGGREESRGERSDEASIFASVGDYAICDDPFIRVLLQSCMPTESMRNGASFGIAVERFSFLQLGVICSSQQEFA
eukprot:2788773-Pyramimonas_sp.AAC.1